MEYFNILIQGDKVTVSDSKSGFYEVRLKGNYIGYMELVNGSWVLQGDHYFTPFEIGQIAVEIINHFQSVEFYRTGYIYRQ